LSDLPVVGSGKHADKDLQFIAAVGESVKHNKTFLDCIVQRGKRESTVMLDPRADSLALYKNFRLKPLTEELKRHLTAMIEKGKCVNLLDQHLMCPNAANTCTIPTVEQMADKKRQSSCLFNYRYCIEAKPEDLLAATSAGKNFPAPTQPIRFDGHSPQSAI
jgi:hypothetical protein